MHSKHIQCFRVWVVFLSFKPAHRRSFSPRILAVYKWQRLCKRVHPVKYYLPLYHYRKKPSFWVGSRRKISTYFLQRYKSITSDPIALGERKRPRAMRRYATRHNVEIKMIGFTYVVVSDQLKAYTWPRGVNSGGSCEDS